MTDLIITDNKSGTTAELIDRMIEQLKKSGKQNMASYDRRSRRVISILDSNKDADRDMTFEQYEAIARNAVNIKVERKQDGEYDWWITFYPEMDPLTGLMLALRIVA